MASIRKSITINAPVEKVFAFMLDPMNNLKTMPSMQAVSDIQALANGGNSFRWKYKMAGITFDGQSQDTAIIPNQFMEVASKGGINSTWKWMYKADGSATKLSLDLEYTVPVPVLGKLAEALIVKTNEQEAQLMMDNIKLYCEAG